MIVELIIAAILSAGPPVLVKMYVQDGEKNNNYLYISLIISILILIVYIDLIKKYGATIMYTIAKVLSIVIVAAIGYFYLDETLTTKQLIGLALSLVAMYLLS